MKTIEKLKQVLEKLNNENYEWMDLMPQRCVDNERFLLQIERETLGTSSIQEKCFQNARIRLMNDSIRLKHINYSMFGAEPDLPKFDREAEK